MIIGFRHSERSPPSTYMGSKIGWKTSSSWESQFQTSWHGPSTPHSWLKKAQQRLFFFGKLKQAKLPREMLMNFYRRTIESILTERYASCTTTEQLDLHRVVKAAQRIIRLEFPGLDTIYHNKLSKKAHNIYTDITHPGHCSVWNTVLW